MGAEPSSDKSRVPPLPAAPSPPLAATVSATVSAAVSAAAVPSVGSTRCVTIRAETARPETPRRKGISLAPTSSSLPSIPRSAPRQPAEPSALQFKFEVEDRILCTESGRVAYRRTPNNLMGLEVPMDLAVEALVEEEARERGKCRYSASGLPACYSCPPVVWLT